MTRVNLFFVGAGKCGTTWLYGLTKAHNNISVSKVKETLFFENNKTESISKYHSFFDLNTSYKYIAEFSNTYIFHPVVPERIHAYNPGAKIIFTVRNPVNRAVSHYQFLLRGGKTLPPFEEAIYDPRYTYILKRGCFFSFIQNYLDFFEKDSVTTLILEDLIHEKDTYIQQLSDFLGLNFSSVTFDEAIYKLPASKPRLKILAKGLKHGANLARKIGGQTLIQYLKESPIPRIAYKKLDDKDQIKISERLYYQLVDYYREDVSALSDFTSRDLHSLWFSESEKKKIVKL